MQFSCSLISAALTDHVTLTQHKETLWLLLPEGGYEVSLYRSEE